jgi:hypothetical protein
VTASRSRWSCGDELVDAILALHHLLGVRPPRGRLGIARVIGGEAAAHAVPADVGRDDAQAGRDVDRWLPRAAVAIGFLDERQERELQGTHAV